MKEFEKTTYSGIFGRAGSGKSTLLRDAAERSNGSYALCSTTGISAVNLGAGITLHSLLWFHNHQSLLNAWTTGKLDYRLGELYGKMGIRRILCDEASLLSAEDLSVICMGLESLNNTVEKKGKQKLGLTLCGDWCQLPVIEGRFAFESEYWSVFEKNITFLDKIHRQDDKEFIQALQWVREGDGKQAAEYFRDRMYQLGDPKFEGTTLYPYNSQVDRQNQYRLEGVRGEKVCFTAERSGKQRAEWEKLIPDKLELKIGALVVILANNYVGGKLQYCNGDLGTLEGADGCAAVVRLKRTNSVVKVKKIRRLNEQIVKDEKKVVGDIVYEPVRLAFASTVHYSQGLTLDNVQIDFRSKFYKKCPGMLYVALSRCRSKEGLRLIGSPRTFVQNCTVNEKVRRFL